MSLFGKLLPAWVPWAVIGGLAVVAAGAIWLLLETREALGAEKLKAAVTAAALSVYQQQEAANQVLDQRLERLERQRGESVKEVVREVWKQQASDACRNSPAMRALDGRLRYDAGGNHGRPAGAAAPPVAVPPAGRSARPRRRPRAGRMGGRDLAARPRLCRQGRRLDRLVPRQAAAEVAAAGEGR